MNHIKLFSKEVAKKIAVHLLETGAVKLRPDAPFTWSSGWKSPIYCDNRILLSYPGQRSFVRDAFCEAIKSDFPQAEAIAGVATAGIAQGALVAEKLGLPFLYVRPKPKDHGMGNQIEGRLPENCKVVVLEDLVSTGGSSLGAVQALRNGRAEILGMVAVFHYGFDTADNNFKEAKVPLTVLSNYEALIEHSKQTGAIDDLTEKMLLEWRQDPANWRK